MLHSLSRPAERLYLQPRIHCMSTNVTQSARGKQFRVGNALTSVTARNIARTNCQTDVINSESHQAEATKGTKSRLQSKKNVKELSKKEEIGGVSEVSGENPRRSKELTIEQVFDVISDGLVASVLKEAKKLRGRKKARIKDDWEDAVAAVSTEASEKTIKRKRSIVTKSSAATALGAKIELGRRPRARAAFNDIPKAPSLLDFEGEAAAASKKELIKYLDWVIEKGKFHRRGTPRSQPSLKQDIKDRINIIDGGLCDDIIERLALSLNKHKGCDIIDISPGIGLFSSKLHKYLKPRTHILMEPYYEAYKPTLGPLLDAHDSKYRLVQKYGISWEHLETVLNKEHLPFQEAYEPGDPRLGKPNDSLLVVANLATLKRSPFESFTSLAAVVLYQFLSASRLNSLFHKYGKVRTLIWVDEEEAKCLPQNVGRKRKFALEAEVSCKHIEAIVQSDPDSLVGRELRLDIDRVKSVLKNMKDLSLPIPKGRESKLVQAFKQGKTGNEVEELSPKSLQESLRKMKLEFSSGNFEKHAAIKPTNKQAFNYTSEYTRMLSLERRCERASAMTSKFMDAADQYDAILALEKEISSHTDPDRLNEKQRMLRSLTEVFENTFSSFAVDDQACIDYIIDNRRICSQKPPVLFWDRRIAEPMVAQPGEFYPPKLIGLFDFQPASTPIFLKNRTEMNDFLIYITSQIMSIPRGNMEESIKSLAPGALEWMVQECPSLTDPLKGGSRNLRTLRCRCVTAEMILEMVDAWARWPFKLQRNELLHRLGSEVFDFREDDT